MKKNIFISLILVTSFIAAGTMIQLKTKTSVNKKNIISITASFYPLAYLAEHIGGEKISVVNITPAGAEPHEFEPTPRDIAELETSDLLIVNGLGLEPWYENIKKNINPEKTHTIVASDNLDINKGDPHIWLSPHRMKIVAEKIEASLSSLDPINSDDYLFRLTSVKQNLDLLDQEYKKGLRNCVGKEFITSHKAFGYLADDYGLTQIPIAGFSPDTEPSAKDMGVIVSLAKNHNIKYIFFESLVSPKLSNAIAEEVEAKTLVLNPIEGLTDEDIKNGKDYMSVMRENLVNLQTALSCIK